MLCNITLLKKQVNIRKCKTLRLDLTPWPINALAADTLSNDT